MKQLLLAGIILFFYCCNKNKTTIYKDSDALGLSIFSNNGNNILYAYLNNEPWRTKDRYAFSSSTNYELKILKYKTANQPDSLLFTWVGLSEANRDFRYRVLQLHLVLPLNFNFNYFKNNLESKRIVIDPSIGYFSTYNNDASAWQAAPKKGNGVIYFNKAYIDTTIRLNDTLYTGKLSGLLEAKFDSIEFKNGRFDHLLEDKQLNIK